MFPKRSLMKALRLFIVWSFEIAFVLVLLYYINAKMVTRKEYEFNDDPPLKDGAYPQSESGPQFSIHEPEQKEENVKYMNNDVDESVEQSIQNGENLDTIESVNRDNLEAFKSDEFPDIQNGANPADENSYNIQNNGFGLEAELNPMGLEEEIPTTTAVPMTKSKNFVVLANGRSGTHFLMHLMNNHPMVKTYGELLQTETILGPLGLLGRGRKPILDYLTEAFCKDKRPCLLNNMIGFIWLNWQVTKLGKVLVIDDLLRFLHSPRVIILHRRHTIESFVSLRIAQETGVINSGSVNNASSVYIDWTKFVKYVTGKRLEWQRSMNALYSYPFKMFVTYEELVENKEETMAKVFSFMGLPAIDASTLTTSIVKLNPRPLKEKVSNWDEIEVQLQNAPKKLVDLDLKNENPAKIMMDPNEL
ncbi:unnamed protein product [Owenia fusiformis]|uniref:Uncharacterized protein n=1 Tax=Owenia fusiformis TaxID=6347 RepID=A0A8J1XH22_OWEFU|nr:unnamed protein product [Owenia fusiformis]